MSGRIAGETMQSVLEIEDPGQLADVIAANVLSKIEDRQQVLEEFDELARLESVCALLVRETELAGVEKKVQARVRKQIEQNQKDYFCLLYTSLPWLPFIWCVEMDLRLLCR